ncbi:MAG: NYN domain-containing protein [Thermoleophilaceae bacterium]
MHWLVDGMNVIGSRPDGWWRDRDGAVQRLVGELASLVERSGDAVAVVFDGRPVKLEDPGRVDVRFATRSGRDAADDDIAALAQAGLTVVTSDAGLAERVRAAGADVVGAGTFRARHLG